MLSASEEIELIDYSGRLSSSGEWAEKFDRTDTISARLRENRNLRSHFGVRPRFMRYVWGCDPPKRRVSLRQIQIPRLCLVQ